MGMLGNRARDDACWHPRLVASTAGLVAVALVGAIGFATAITAELPVPQDSRADLSRPDVEHTSSSRLEPSHAEHDTWTPADIEWSRPEVERRLPADFERSRPDIE